MTSNEIKMMEQAADLEQTVAVAALESGEGLEEVAVSEAEEDIKRMVFWEPGAVSIAGKKCRRQEYHSHGFVMRSMPLQLEICTNIII